MSAVFHALGISTSTRTTTFNLRFMSEEDGLVYDGVSMRVEALMKIKQLHCLIGRGSGIFEDKIFCIPGTSAVPCWNTTILIALPFKPFQTQECFLLGLEAAIEKALEETPA